MLKIVHPYLFSHLFEIDIIELLDFNCSFFYYDTCNST